MRALQPIESVALGDRILEAVRLAIIQNELEAGRKISDRELAEALNVSRTPVREALHQLEGIGLVESTRSGWIVAPFTERDIRELFELRRLLEPLGLAKLEKDPDEEVIAKLATFFDDFDAEVPEGDYPTYLARDRAFHELIIDCSDNRKLCDFYRLISSHIDRGRHYLSTPRSERVDSTLREHVAICQAIGARDFARARDELVHHLGMGEELMINFLRARDSRGG